MVRETMINSRQTKYLSIIQCVTTITPINVRPTKRSGKTDICYEEDDGSDDDDDDDDDMRTSILLTRYDMIINSNSDKKYYEDTSLISRFIT